MKVRLFFVAQWILVPNVFVAQWILVKNDQIEIFRSLYFSLKSWLCCCSLASLVPQQIYRSFKWSCSVNMANSSASVCETNCISVLSEVDSTNSDSLSSRDVTVVYLITYSQANLEIVPTREVFAPIILDAFDNAVPESSAAEIQWVCSQESHADGDLHYQVVKLSGQRWWRQLRNYIDQE